MTTPTAEKAASNGSAPVDPKVIARSVEDQPEKNTAPFSMNPGFFIMASAADELEPWGRNSKMRDLQLRQFIGVEPTFTSALGTVCARNAAFSWKLEGPEEETSHFQDILQNAEYGAGWAEFILNVSIDLYTQDHGAFIEIIRAKDSADSEVIGIRHLDAARCYPTGVAEEPVWYQDIHGKYHRMKWYQVSQLRDSPAAYQTLPGLQYCALTRALIRTQITRDQQIYMKEKVGGRQTRAITAVRGLKADDVLNAIGTSQILNDSQGRMRYSNPVLVSSADPNAEVGFETLEIASLPDGFDEEKDQKLYLTVLSLAFMTDYQEFAPLPGGGLGTGSQSEILDKKSRGKGPGLFMKLISQFINFAVLPDTVEFKWDEQDIQEDLTVAQVKEVRANTRKVMLETQQISLDVAWMMMLEDGDLTQEQYDLLLKQQEELRLAEEEAAAEAEAMAGEMAANGQQPVDEETTPAAQFDVNAGMNPEATKDLPIWEQIEKWSEATQLRDPKGRFAGTIGGGGGGGAAGAGAAEEPNNQPPRHGYPVDDKGQPIPSSEALAYGARLEKWGYANKETMDAEMQGFAREMGGEMVGIDFSVKSTKSAARKIETDHIAEQMTYKDAASHMGDPMRYTMVFTPDKYTAGAEAAMARAGEHGFEVFKAKNFWKDGDQQYRGINTQMFHKDTGMIVELQFHTMDSFNMKETGNHTIYEEARLLTTPKARRDELIQQMRDNFKTVPEPPGVMSIKAFKAPVQPAMNIPE